MAVHVRPKYPPLSKVQIAEFSYQAKVESLVQQTYGITKTQQCLTRHISDQVTHYESLAPNDKKTYIEVMSALQYRTLEVGGTSKTVGRQDNTKTTREQLQKNAKSVDIYKKSRDPVVIKAISDFEKTEDFKRQLGSEKHNEVVNSFVSRGQGVLGLACAYGQIVTGYAMSATGAGSLAGVPLMALGADGAQKAWGQLCGNPEASSISGDVLFVAMSAAGRPIKRERCEEIFQMGSVGASGLIGMAGALQSGGAFNFLIQADALQACVTGKDITSALITNALVKYGSLSETDAQAASTGFFVIAQSKSTVQGAHQVKMAYDKNAKKFVDGEIPIVKEQPLSETPVRGQQKQSEAPAREQKILKIRDRNDEKSLYEAGRVEPHTEVNQAKIISLNGTDPHSAPATQAGEAKVVSLNAQKKAFSATGTDGVPSNSTTKQSAGVPVVRMETGLGGSSEIPVPASVSVSHASSTSARSAHISPATPGVRPNRIDEVHKIYISDLKLKLENYDSRKKSLTKILSDNDQPLIIKNEAKVEMSFIKKETDNLRLHLKLSEANMLGPNGIAPNVGGIMHAVGMHGHEWGGRFNDLSVGNISLVVGNLKAHIKSSLEIRGYYRVQESTAPGSPRVDKQCIYYYSESTKKVVIYYDEVVRTESLQRGDMISAFQLSEGAARQFKLNRRTDNQGPAFPINDFLDKYGIH